MMTEDFVADINEKGSLVLPTDLAKSYTIEKLLELIVPVAAIA